MHIRHPQPQYPKPGACCMAANRMTSALYAHALLIGTGIVGFPGIFCFAEPREGSDEVVRFLRSERPGDWRTAFEHGTELLEVDVGPRREVVRQIEQFVHDAAPGPRLWASALLLLYEANGISTEMDDGIAFETLARRILSRREDGLKSEAIEIASSPAFASSFLDAYPIWTAWEYEDVPDETREKFLVVRVLSLMSRPEDYVRRFLRSSVASQEAAERGLAVCIAAHCDPLIAVPVCQHGANDDSAFVRFMATCGAGSVSVANPDMAGRLSSIIVSSLLDDDPQVRQAASWWIGLANYSEVVPRVSAVVEADIIRTMNGLSLAERAGYCRVLRMMGLESSAAAAAAADFVRDAAASGEYYAELEDALVVLLSSTSREHDGPDIVKAAVEVAARSEMKGYRLSGRLAWFSTYGPSREQPWNEWRAVVFGIEEADPWLWLAGFRTLMKTAPGKGERRTVFLKAIGDAPDEVAIGVIGGVLDGAVDGETAVRWLRQAMQSSRDMVRTAAAGALLQFEPGDSSARRVLRREVERARASGRSFDVAVDGVCRWEPASAEDVAERLELLASVVLDEGVDLNNRIRALRAMIGEAGDHGRVVTVLEGILGSEPRQYSHAFRRVAITAVAEGNFRSSEVARHLAEAAVGGRPSEQDAARATIEKYWE